MDRYGNITSTTELVVIESILIGICLYLVFGG